MATVLLHGRGYELKEEIGAGAYGVVHRAHQAAAGRDVAIKIILPTYADQPDFAARFDAEAKLVARLEHPHIVPLYDTWRDENGAHLVMRLLRGRYSQGPAEDRTDGTRLRPRSLSGKSFLLWMLHTNKGSFIAI